ncbi:helix-turn-helix transcriptional regulator [Arachidicoccus terrestris]|uniref:helix-turn-helix transcriptional regulator n=1 Tax=Arachidicoccus terrestris TaxID=2875539 RepID=UPI001CC3FD49|nr:AraC family transcriptional regulator [Arachidicoccus terrestris]UAY54627.1 AraC family transcriptional regulator [Arachidicoccus terrestris]
MPQNYDPHTPEALRDFAKTLGVPISHNRINIPQEYGKGYCTGFTFNEQIRMLIMDYELNREIVLANPDTDIRGKMILFKFQHVLPESKRANTQLPSVMIATRKVQADIIIPVHTQTATINIEVNAAYLASLLVSKNQSVILSQLLENNQPLLFEQTVYPSMLQIVDEIIKEPVKEPFRLFFLRVKAEELICRLLIELESRPSGRQLHPLNRTDIQVIYNIRENILAHLATPPTLATLASSANMSISKLKTLFKQVFGKSIYSYYQQFRIQEAARLLAERQLSVSEVGYHLGFSNLSHFSRVFNQHIGMKPKRFSMQK